MGNEPPRPLQPPPPERAALYERLGIEGYQRTVAEYAVQLPNEFLGNLWRKVLYSVGFFERSGITGYGAERGTSWLYLGMWVAALAGAIRLLCSSTRYPTAVVSLPGLAALCHFGAVVMIFPHVYGDRLILPIYPLLIPYAAFALEPLAVWAWRHSQQVAPFLLVMLTLSIFLPDFPRSSTLVWVMVAAAAVMAFTVGPQPLGRVAWLYVGYTAGVILVFTREPVNAESLRFELLLPIASFAVARLSREERTRGLVVSALLVGALISVVGVEMTLSESASAALPRRLLHVAVAGFAVFALLGRRWPTAVRASSVLAGGCMVLAIVLATFAKAGLLETGTDLRKPVVSALAGEMGILGVLCLLGLWLRATVGTARAAWSGRSRSLAVCHGALVAMLLMSLAMALPPSWHPAASGYPPVALGVLLGLVEAGVRRSPV
jgi:hypothetical protein